MRVLMLTWEYPPFIVGGLGMACYGLFKALSSLGVTVDFILPVKEDVYFEIKSPDEADHPRVKSENGKEAKDNKKPLEFFEVIYEIPEEGAYASLKDFIVEVSKSLGVPLREPKLQVPDEVISRLKYLLLQRNHMISKVSLYTEKVLRIAERLGFDLVHAHDWLTYPAGLMLKKYFNKPLVSHIHATEFDRALGFGHPIIHEIEYLGLNYADRVIAVSRYTANIIKEHYFVPEEKVRVVYNAYYAETQSPQKIKKFKEPVVLFLGRLTPQKGPTIFLELAKKVLERTKKVRFLVAGAGEMERELMLWASSFGYGAHIMFTGFLKRAEVERALSLADIVIMPSPSEPFGIVALEAMHFGCALILSKQSGASEIVKSAYVVDYWDVDKMVDIVLELINNPELLKAKQDEARREVQTFRWEDRAREVLEVYREVLS
ncbi:MAG: glycosyltransferase family 4 protein [Thermodesulfobacteriaceae bacterium]